MNDTERSSQLALELSRRFEHKKSESKHPLDQAMERRLGGKVWRAAFGCRYMDQGKEYISADQAGDSGPAESDTPLLSHCYPVAGARLGRTWRGV